MNYKTLQNTEGLSEKDTWIWLAYHHGELGEVLLRENDWSLQMISRALEDCRTYRLAKQSPRVFNYFTPELGSEVVKVIALTYKVKSCLNSGISIDADKIESILKDKYYTTVAITRRAIIQACKDAAPLRED